MEERVIRLLEARKAFGEFVSVHWQKAGLSPSVLGQLLGEQRCAQFMAYLQTQVVLPIELVHDLALALKVAPSLLLEKYLSAYHPAVAQAIARSCGRLAPLDLAQVLDEHLPELPADQEYVMWDRKDVRAAA